MVSDTNDLSNTTAKKFRWIPWDRKYIDIVSVSIEKPQSRKRGER